MVNCNTQYATVTLCEYIYIRKQLETHTHTAVINRKIYQYTLLRSFFFNHEEIGELYNEQNDSQFFFFVFVNFSLSRKNEYFMKLDVDS